MNLLELKQSPHRSYKLYLFLTMKSESEPIYFEEQGKLSSLCAVHAINNLLGSQASSEQHLNIICKSISKDFINPHKHLFGGDFDANVVIIALQELGYECQWLDSRQVESIIVDCSIENERRVGYLLNRKMKVNKLKQLFGLSQRHWLCLKNVKGEYFELDSQSEEKKPKLIENIQFFLENQLLNQSHLIQVLRKGQ